MQENHKESLIDVKCRKSKLKLDLPLHNFGKSVLSSPDIHKLKMKSPELENFIIQQNGLNNATPTPNTTQILFPKADTEELDSYTRGFVDGFGDFNCSDSSQGGNPIDISNSSSNNSVTTYTDLDPRRVGGFSSINTNYNSCSPLGVIIKDEPQTVPSMTDSPNLSPIDMESQEVFKLERKRMRNRVAASKCRRRKLERIARLEDKVKQLKGENNDLSAFIVKLKDIVCALKGEVMEHVNSGCQIMSYA